MATEKKIEDFGEKIGGARKDLVEFRKKGGFTVDEIEHWSPAEREEGIVKKELFPVPDYQKMVDEQGFTKEAAYFYKRVRDSLPAKPDTSYIVMNGRNEHLPEEEIQANVVEYQNRYINFVNEIKNRLSEIKTIDYEAKHFFTNLLRDKEQGLVDIKELFYQKEWTKISKAADLSSNYGYSRFKQEFNKKQFLWTDAEKAEAAVLLVKYDGNNIQKQTSNGRDILQYKNYGSTYWFHHCDEKFLNMSEWKLDTYCIIDRNRGGVVANNLETIEDAKAFALEYYLGKQETEKKDVQRREKLLPPQLAFIRRDGEDFRDGIDVDGEDMLAAFGFRGGEFGNWENQNDRQTNLNMSYEAFKDIAKALNISDKDVGLGGQLAIAYGARGRGNALAHYEKGYNVINLTKMRGAGSLAHEFGHALDAYVAEAQQRTVNFETEAYRGAFADVLRTMKINPDTREATEFYRDAKLIDASYSKSGHDYWQSEKELFARAFACYIKDKLSPDRSDYLCGHAELPPTRVGKNFDKTAYTYPRGEERERINAAFDRAFEYLKEKGLFHEREPEKEHKIIHVEIEIEDEKPKKAKKETVEKGTEAVADTPTVNEIVSSAVDKAFDKLEQDGLISSPTQKAEQQVEQKEEQIVFTQLSFMDVLNAAEHTQEAENKLTQKENDRPSEDYKLYSISGDFGETWTEQWLTEDEALAHKVMGYVVNECKGFNSENHTLSSPVQETAQEISQETAKYEPSKEVAQLANDTLISILTTEQERLKTIYDEYVGNIDDTARLTLENAVYQLNDCIDSLRMEIKEGNREMKPLNFSTDQITKADSTFYIIDFAGENAIEAVSRGADIYPPLRQEIEKAGGVAEMLAGDDYPYEFYIAKTNEGAVALRFTLMEQDIDVPIELTAEEIGKFAEKLDVFEEAETQRYIEKVNRNEKAADMGFIK